jgi:hypothetical protein
VTKFGRMETEGADSCLHWNRENDHGIGRASAEYQLYHSLQNSGRMISIPCSSECGMGVILHAITLIWYRPKLCMCAASLNSDLSYVCVPPV